MKPFLPTLFLILFLAGCSAAPASPPLAPSATAAPATLAPETAAPTLAQPSATPQAATPAGGETPAATLPSAAPSPVPSTNAVKLPDPAGFDWVTVVSGLTRPVDLADDGQGHLLIVEQPGRILTYENGALQPSPFLDLTDRVGSQGNEQGLLGLALHPRYAENGYLYVNYTDKDGNTVIARFTGGDPASEKVLLRVDQPYANHNGGGMAFGPDGDLYIALGDGGSAGDPQNRAQNLNSLLGKLLRIDVDGGDPYAVPSGNPFVSGGGSPEIWALGLRNPWRFSFDRLTGDLWIGDVGQNQWEEINYSAGNRLAGVNYGWRYREGANPYQGQPPAGLALTDPLFQYEHPTGCSVTGGVVYRGAALPEFSGVYLYGDYCTGRIWGALQSPDGTWQNRQLFQYGFFISSFGQDARGEVYLFDHRAGALLRLERKPSG